jgi:hypothetical protein
MCKWSSASSLKLFLCWNRCYSTSVPWLDGCWKVFTMRVEKNHLGIIVPLNRPRCYANTPTTCSSTAFVQPIFDEKYAVILGRRYASRNLCVTGFANARWSTHVNATTTPRLPSYLGLRRFRLGSSGFTSEFSRNSCRSCTTTSTISFSRFASSTKFCKLF